MLVALASSRPSFSAVELALKPAKILLQSQAVIAGLPKTYVRAPTRVASRTVQVSSRYAYARVHPRVIYSVARQPLLLSASFPFVSFITRPLRRRLRYASNIVSPASRAAGAGSSNNSRRASPWNGELKSRGRFGFRFLLGLDLAAGNVVIATRNSKFKLLLRR